VPESMDHESRYALRKVDVGANNNHPELGNGTIDPKGGSNVPVVLKGS
jgi:hypothetical protein